MARFNRSQRLDIARANLTRHSQLLTLPFEIEHGRVGHEIFITGWSRADLNEVAVPFHSDRLFQKKRRAAFGASRHLISPLTYAIPRTFGVEQSHSICAIFAKPLTINSFLRSVSERIAA
jgi:hypothetical protein